MTSTTGDGNWGAEETQDDALEQPTADGAETPGEYEPADEGGVSEDTGVAYDAEGEPETTPEDLIDEDAEEE
ncbi:MAG: hypothetical protein ACXVW2_06365 [Nocardioidaceae bacterium]